MSKLKSRPKYICSNPDCEKPHSTYMGVCNGCGKFNTIVENKEVVESINMAKSVSNKSSITCMPGKNLAKKLNEVEGREHFRIETGIGEFDRVMGGGIVRNSVTIVTAQPGAGKSTLLIEVANTVAKLGYMVLYATGEEAETQVKNRADRVLDDISDNLKIISSNSMEDIKTTIESIDAKLAIVDSIQAVGLSHIDSSIGSTKQAHESAQVITKMAKSSENPRAFILVGQKNKDNELAGAKQMEHLVDAVIHLEGDNDLKMLRGAKNRFGDIDEVGMFQMTSEGMEEASDISIRLITQRDVGVPGSALGVIREGKRPLVVEIESLVSKCHTAYPTRSCENFKREALTMLVSVVSKKCLLRMDDQDVLLKPTGDIKVMESASNLASVMSIISSRQEKAIPSGVVFIGEVGLTGEVKKVNYLEARIKEVDRLGFNKVVIPNQKLKLNEADLGIKIVRVNDINECKKMFEM